MSTLGKVLVILHGALALAVLTWAIGVYTHRIQWNNPPAGATQADGVFARQKSRADEYNVAVERAYTRWSGNLAQVEFLENQRYPRRGFYAGQLQMAETGKLPNGQDARVPVQQLVIAPNGYLDLRPEGRPAYEVRPGVPADSAAGYQRKMAQLMEDIKASQARNATAIDERNALNREIIGVEQPMVVKGIRRRLNEQTLILDQAKAEDQYVATFVTNREAEFGLLKKRRDALTARMGELADAKKPDEPKKP